MNTKNIINDLLSIFRTIPNVKEAYFENPNNPKGYPYIRFDTMSCNRGREANRLWIDRTTLNFSIIAELQSKNDTTTVNREKLVDIIDSINTTLSDISDFKVSHNINTRVVDFRSITFGDAFVDEALHLYTINFSIECMIKYESV